MGTPSISRGERLVAEYVGQADRVAVFVVRRWIQGGGITQGGPVLVAAYLDRYDAKHDASRREEETKAKHDFVESWLEVPSEDAHEAAPHNKA